MHGTCRCRRAKTHRSALCCVQNTITKKCQYRCISSAVSRSLASPHGVRRLISPADNPGGVTVSNCCGTIASVGLHRRASAECRRHDWSSLPSMYRISAHNGLRIRFFIRSSLIVLRVVFLVKLNRIMSITIMQPDKRSSCVTGMNRSRRRRADQRSMAAIWTG